ncbi:MAG: hypothetical protein AAF192_10470 [Pseudomonadota bacterium]
MPCLHAAPETRPRPRHLLSQVGGPTVLNLQTAVLHAGPGDCVRLEPGRYRDPIVVPVSGRRDAPIRIVGPDDHGAVLDGGRRRGDGLLSGFDPMDDDFAFIKVMNAGHLVFENLTFENCWPAAAFLRGPEQVTFLNCRFREGRFAVFARALRDGAGRMLRPGRGITLEGCEWVQDPRRDM